MVLCCQVGETSGQHKEVQLVGKTVDLLVGAFISETCGQVSGSVRVSDPTEMPTVGLLAGLGVSNVQRPAVSLGTTDRCRRV